MRSVPPSGQVTINASPPTPGSKPLQIKVKALVLHRAGKGPLVVMLALYENGFVTKIGGGEKGGHEITYDLTVREAVSAFELDATEGSSSEKDLTIDLEPSWSVNHMGVAALIWDTISLRILGATSPYPIARN